MLGAGNSTRIRESTHLWGKLNRFMHQSRIISDYVGWTNTPHQFITFSSVLKTRLLDCSMNNKHHNPCEIVSNSVKHSCKREIVSNFVKHSCKQVGLTCSHLSHHCWWWWYKFCSGTRKNTWQAYCTLIPRCYWLVWERVSKVAAMIHYFRKI